MRRLHRRLGEILQTERTRVKERIHTAQSAVARCRSLLCLHRFSGGARATFDSLAYSRLSVELQSLHILKFATTSASEQIARSWLLVHIFFSVIAKCGSSTCMGGRSPRSLPASSHLIGKSFSTASGPSRINLAMISPRTDENLKPCPEHAEIRLT